MKFLSTPVLAVLVIFFGSCGRMTENHHVQRIDSNEALIARAERFTLRKNGSCTIATIINPWQGANDVNQVYFLMKKGSKLPDGLDSSSVIFVPLKKIICMSTTHIMMISALGEAKTITGMSGTGFIYSPDLIRNVELGLIEDVGYDADLNKELIITISPDLIMMYGIGSESESYTGKLEELGVKVVYNADYLETDPLGRAEWIKFFGALYCKENLADSIYNKEVEEYSKLRSFIDRNAKRKPKVLLGFPYKDTWYISPGNSFISKMINDAGGNYLWQNTRSSISMPVGIENVYFRGLAADYWLNIGSVSSRKEIMNVDPRLGNLQCFKNDNLYNNIKRVTAKGGNDYWESGSLYPHLILKDIATILHPELFRDKELFFYKKIY
jgi:iron complex transport system substrate-binding protein